MRGTLQLRCGVLRESIVFTVEIPHDADVAQLTEAIVTTKEDATSLFRVAPHQLALYLARKPDNKWLQVDADMWHTLKQRQRGFSEKLLHEASVRDYFGADWEPRPNEIHVLVQCPHATTRGSEYPRLNRLCRWEEINDILTECRTRAVSLETWTKLAPVFNKDACRRAVMPLPIPEKDLGVLSTTISWMLRSYDFTLIDAKNNGAVYRPHLISPVVWSVAQLLPDVKVHVELDVRGNRVEADGHFAFALERGRKWIGIYQVRDEMFRFGMTEALLGCEVLADLYDTSEVYAVVADGDQWHFLQSFDARILCDVSTVLTFDVTSAARSVALNEVTGKLYALLTN